MNRALLFSMCLLLLSACANHKTKNGYSRQPAQIAPCIDVKQVSGLKEELSNAITFYRPTLNKMPFQLATPEEAAQVREKWHNLAFPEGFVPDKYPQAHSFCQAVGYDSAVRAAWSLLDRDRDINELNEGGVVVKTAIKNHKLYPHGQYLILDTISCIRHKGEPIANFEIRPQSTLQDTANYFNPKFQDKNLLMGTSEEATKIYRQYGKINGGSGTLPERFPRLHELCQLLGHKRAMTAEFAIASGDKDLITVENGQAVVRSIVMKPSSIPRYGQTVSEADFTVRPLMVHSLTCSNR